MGGRQMTQQRRTVAVPTVVSPNGARGMMIYDIPTENMRLYMRVWKAMRRLALQLNKSVYMIDWGHRDYIEGLIEDAMRETGQDAVASFVKVDPASMDELNRMAKSGLQRAINEAIGRLRAKIDKAREENKEEKSEYFGRVQEQLNTIEAQAVLFGFTADIEGLVKSAKDTLQVQWEARARRLTEAGLPIK